MKAEEPSTRRRALRRTQARPAQSGTEPDCPETAEDRLAWFNAVVHDVRTTSLRECREKGLVIYCRLSGGTERSAKAKANESAIRIRKWLERQSVPVHGEPFFEIEKGYYFDAETRVMLARAIDFARKIGAAGVLTETPDRYLRHPTAPPSTPVLPTIEQSVGMAQLAGDMRLLSCVPPSLEGPGGSAKSSQIKRGKAHSIKKDGRPTKKVNTRRGAKKIKKDGWLRFVQHLHTSGWSLRKIAVKYELPESTVRRWASETPDKPV